MTHSPCSRVYDDGNATWGEHVADGEYNTAPPD
jgi:hypothetical protein